MSEQVARERTATLDFIGELACAALLAGKEAEARALAHACKAIKSGLHRAPHTKQEARHGECC